MPADDGADVARAAIVYGEDDRVEPYQAPAPFAQLALRAVVALVDPDELSSGDGGLALSTRTLEQHLQLCPGERFAGQPAGVRASGVLIAPDLVVTAGHVFFGDSDCRRFRYVFGYALEPGEPAPRIDPDDVYECAELLAQVSSPLHATCQWDLALIRLARPVSEGPRPVQLRDGPLADGEPLAVLGFPAGLPAKVDLGAQVIDARAGRGDYFTLDSDTFFASSGSGVFDREGRLVGVIARGGRDFDHDDAGACNRVHRAPDAGEHAGEGYEEATRSRALLELLGLAAERSAARCALEPACAMPPCLPAPAIGVARDEPRSAAARRRPQASCSGAAGAHGPSAPALAGGLALALALVARRRRA